MHSRKLKWASPLFIIFLALASVFGATSAIIDSQRATEEPVVEKAEAASSFLSGSTVFLKPNCWASGAAFIAHFFNDDGSKTYDVWMSYNDMTTSDYYFTTVPTVADVTYTKVIFCRMNPVADQGESGGWWIDHHKVWNQTDTYGAGGDLFVKDNEWNQTGSWTTFDTVQTWNFMYGPSGGEWTSSANFAYKNESDGATFYGMVSLDVTDGWKPHREQGNWYLDSGYVESSSPSVVNGYLQPNGSSDGTVLKKDTTDFYVKIYNNSIYAQSGTDLATEYGGTFLASITCNNGVTAPSTANWSTMSSNYAALSAAPQHIFKIASSAGSTDLNKAVARYDYIVNKYGTSKYSDFASRKSGGNFTYGLARNSTLFTLLTGDDNNITTIIIVVASSVALLSVTALSILVIKKRKQKEE